MRTALNRGNDYGMDWEMHRSKMVCGIPGFGVQDQAIQESQGAIVDRTRERLGTSDTAIIHVRRRLMDEAAALRAEGARRGECSPESFFVRSCSFLLPAGADWVEAAKARVVARPGGQLTLA